MNRSERLDFAKFPVYFPVTREFVAETGSTVTASATTQSPSNRTNYPMITAAKALDDTPMLRPLAGLSLASVVVPTAERVAAADRKIHPGELQALKLIRLIMTAFPEKKACPAFPLFCTD